MPRESRRLRGLLGRTNPRPASPDGTLSERTTTASERQPSQSVVATDSRLRPAGRPGRDRLACGKAAGGRQPCLADLRHPVSAPAYPCSTHR